VRELVENSLDAAESIGMLPDIDVEMCARVLIKALWHCMLYMLHASRSSLQGFLVQLGDGAVSPQ
jgi:hypothetical protein